MSQAQYLNGYDDGYVDAAKKIKASGQGGSSKPSYKLYHVGTGIGDDSTILPEEVRDLFTTVSKDYNFRLSDLPAVIYVSASGYKPLIEGQRWTGSAEFWPSNVGLITVDPESPTQPHVCHLTGITQSINY